MSGLDKPLTAVPDGQGVTSINGNPGPDVSFGIPDLEQGTIAELTDRVSDANLLHVPDSVTAQGDFTPSAAKTANDITVFVGPDLEVTVVDGVSSANIVANNAHREGDGSDHALIDQDVTAGSAPVFDGANFYNVRPSVVFTYSWAMKDAPYLEVNAAAWMVAARFVYPGTSVVGEPTAIEASVWGAAGIANGEIRLRDVTNGVTVADASGITSASDDNVEALTVTGPFPAAAAVFEVQLQGDKKMRVASVVGTKA